MEKIKVLFICHGNICRSTMAESMFIWMVSERGIKERFEINSAATSREEIGNPPHQGTITMLEKKQIPLVPHRAVQVTKKDYDTYDYLICMDEANVRNTTRITGGDPQGKIKRLLSFTNEDRNIADPWYTGNFTATYEDILVGLTALLSHLEQK